MSGWESTVAHPHLSLLSTNKLGALRSTPSYRGVDLTPNGTPTLLLVLVFFLMYNVQCLLQNRNKSTIPWISQFTGLTSFTATLYTFSCFRPPHAFQSPWGVRVWCCDEHQSADVGGLWGKRGVPAPSFLGPLWIPWVLPPTHTPYHLSPTG